jgi:hypothetical protein
MADDADDKPTEPKVPRKVDAGDEIESMRKQISQLRREITSLKKALTDKAEEVVEDADGWLDSASERASRATQALRATAKNVSGIVQESPGTVSSALLAGGIIGLLLGMALSKTQSDHRRWYERINR